MALKFKFAAGKLSIPGSPFKNGMLIFETATGQILAHDLNWSDGKAKYNDMLFNIKVGEQLIIKVDANHRQIRNIIVQFPPDNLNTDDYLEYINSQFFAYPCSVKRVGSVGKFEDKPRESSMIYVLHNRADNNAYMFSVDGKHSGDLIYFSALHSNSTRDGAFGVQLRFEFNCCSKVCTTALAAFQDRDPLQLLRNLGERLAEKLKPSARGWNSWDYFTGSVAAEDMFKNADHQTKIDKSLRYNVIDAGYYPRWGEWIFGERFPVPMHKYCEKMRKKNVIPGIWTAPLCMNVYSRFYMEHPECFGRRSSGEIASKTLGYGATAFLDITHPLTQKYLTASFKELRSAGFEYFKVDFTYELQENCQIFHDANIPRGMLVRKLFELIRAAVGNDSYILACGAPFESVRGLVDAVRSCNDIHNYWSHVLFCAASIAARFWMNGKLWNLDPDFLIIRTHENCSHNLLNKPTPNLPFSVKYPEYWMSGREANIHEMKVWLLLTYVAGGDMFLSDDLTALNEDAIALLKKTIEHKQIAPAIPIDLFDRHDTLPSIWAAKDFVAFFNFTEDPKTLRFKLPPMIKVANNFWGDFKSKVINGELVINLPSRRAEGFFLCKK